MVSRTGIQHQRRECFDASAGSLFNLALGPKSPGHHCTRENSITSATWGVMMAHFPPLPITLEQYSPLLTDILSCIVEEVPLK